jgi:hypothetical protein
VHRDHQGSGRNSGGLQGHCSTRTGEISTPPSQVYRTGMVPLAETAFEVRTSINRPGSAGAGVGDKHPAGRRDGMRKAMNIGMICPVRFVLNCMNDKIIPNPERGGVENFSTGHNALSPENRCTWTEGSVRIGRLFHRLWIDAVHHLGCILVILAHPSI